MYLKISKQQTSTPIKAVSFPFSTVSCLIPNRKKNFPLIRFQQSATPQIFLSISPTDLHAFLSYFSEGVM